MTGEQEHKFVVSAGVASAFVERLRGRVNRLIHDSARPIAWTRTTYLDTPDGAYLASSGSETQRRLRVREYASSAAGDVPRLTGAAFLELKESNGPVRSKIRCAAPPAELQRLVRGQVPGGAITVRTSRAWIALLRYIEEDRPRARVTTWYRRESHVAADGRVRITIDADIAFAFPALLGEAGEEAAPEERRVIERLEESVLEVKLLGPRPQWLEEAMATLPHERERFSKFQRAMAAIDRGATSVSGAG